MFTGIIDHLGRLESLDRSDTGARLRVHAPTLAPPVLGASIAVNGCCLTVAEIAGDAFSADLSAETLRRTAFALTAPGSPLNLERPLTAGKELGGHFVQGHVDGVGRVDHLTSEGGNWRLGILVPVELRRYIAMKGSIAIDGISLTVAGIAGDLVEAAIIPFTYANTNLQSLSTGSPVNIETDVLAKYLECLLAPLPSASSRLTIERLVQEGF
jgi:riboflavin synthase